MRSFFLIAVGIVGLVSGGCAEWRTTPEAVDQRWGMAVRQMRANQTLYPEHSEEETQVLLLDGRKGEKILETYRVPTKNLRDAKQRLDIKVDDD